MLLDHPTAEEVFNCISNGYTSISKATVYRILNRMVDDKELFRLSIPGGADRFDVTLSYHQHAKCVSCGKICDVDIPELPKICSEVSAGCGYSVNGCRIVFEGFCPECQKLIKNN